MLATSGGLVVGCGAGRASVVIGPAPGADVPAGETTIAAAAIANVAAAAPPVVVPELTTTTTTIAPDRRPTQAELDGLQLRLEPVVQLARPTSIVQRPTTTDAYVTSVGGALVRVPLTGGTGTEVANVADLISTRGESGLLDLAFDATGNLLYLSLVERNRDLVVWEVPMVGGEPDLLRWREVIRVPGRSNIHHAGDIHIDAEGLLWFAVGDGDPNDSVTGRAQDLTDLRGKLLRLDPRPQPDGRPYGIPPGNPFLGRTDVCPEIWSFGLRNPWRFSIDERSGSLWIGDVGRYAAEEVNFSSGPAGGAGANFGWPFLEGTEPRMDGGSPDLVPPLLEWSHGDRCAVTGGFVYRGTALPNLVGAYVYSDLCDGLVRAVVEQDGAIVAERVFDDVQAGYPVSFGVDAAGELYFCSFDLDTVFRLVPA